METTNHNANLPLILDYAAKYVGYYRHDSGKLSNLLCKGGRYYVLMRGSMNSIRIGRAEAAEHFVPRENGTVN